MSKNKNKENNTEITKNNTTEMSNLKTNDWRQDKAKVLKFINNNPYIIRKKIIKIIPKTRKNTWKEIKEDLKRQYLIEYNRRKSIRDKKQEKRAKPIDFIQSNIFAEPKEINEPYYPDIEDLFNQVIKSDEEAKALEEQHKQEILNSEIEKIKNANIAKDGLKIYFKEKEGVNFNNLKKAIRDKINSIDLNAIYIEISFLTYYNNYIIEKTQSFSLNSEKGRKNFNNILRGGDFEDMEPDEDFKIEVSDMNDFSLGKISINQITSIAIFNQRNRGREIKNKIYADNGGSFYPYKINEKFLNNPALVKKLERYQIFTDLNNKAFKENCLVYAMRQTNLFNEAILNNMRTVCFSRYISKKQLQKFGEMYNIKFYVVKYFSDENKFKDITKGKKFFGSVKDDAFKIKLALIDGHYILNEDVKGVSTYYIKNYDDIENKCKDMKQEEKFKIAKIDNGKYKQNKTRYNEIKSYDFVKFMTSDNKIWPFDDLCHLKNNLYDLSDEIYDLNNFTDRDFKCLYKPPYEEYDLNKLSGEKLNKLFALNFEADEFDEDDELDDYTKRLYLMMKKLGVYKCPH